VSAAALLFRHARPAGAIWVALIPLAGYGVAHWEHALSLRRLGAALLLACAWLAIHAGTMWLNACLDRDDDEVLFGRPAPVPRWLPLAAYAALALGPLLALAADGTSAVCALGCALLGLGYSHAWTRWKAHPVAGPAVNVIGYAVLSPLAGWALPGVAFGARTALVIAILCAYAGAAFLGAQAFQAREDARRGYRTLVVTHGPAVTLTAARACLWAGSGGLAALAALGWLPRSCALVLVPAWVCDRWLAAWLEQAGGGDAGWARGFARRLMVLGVVLFAAAYADYGFDLARGNDAVAGLATPSGRSR
jgi:hypothetical protein